MKETLKRESKLFEVVESEAIVVSVCTLPLISFLRVGFEEKKYNVFFFSNFSRE